MGSALSCLRTKKEGGAVRPVPERRTVSASELQRPSSSFSAGNSQTLEPKRRRSVEVERSTSPNVETAAVVESTEVKVLSAEKLVSTPKTLMDAVRELDEVKDEKVEDMPNVGSTSEDIGATGKVAEETGLVDIHVRADKALVTDTKASEVTEVERVAEFPDKAPSLESMTESLGDAKFASVEKKTVVLEEGVKDRDRKKNVGIIGKVAKGKKAELQRSETMLDVRSILPVQTHVTNYEKIDAAAKVDDEELVKSGKFKAAEA